MPHRAAQLTGATIDIVDVREDIPIIKEIKYQTDYDFIVAVNYNGRQVDINEIKKQNPRSIIIEDSCKSLFSLSKDRSKYSGTIGKYGCYSLGMISALPGIYGGIVTSTEKIEEERLRTLKWHGTKYERGEEIYQYSSFNFKSSNVHAAFALGMLESYEDRLKKLNEIYLMYKEGLKGLENTSLVEVDTDKGEVPLLIDLHTRNRHKMVSHLETKGIKTCNYHKSLSNCPGVNKVIKTMNSEEFGNKIFHPPCGPDQDLSDIDKAIDCIRKMG